MRSKEKRASVLQLGQSQAQTTGHIPLTNHRPIRCKLRHPQALFSIANERGVQLCIVETSEKEVILRDRTKKEIMDKNTGDTTKKTIISHAYGEKDLERMLTERVVEESRAFVSVEMKSVVHRQQWLGTLIGLFFLTTSMTFMAILGIMREHFDICTTRTKQSVRCKMAPDNYTLMGYLMTFLAFLIGLQIGCSSALIWRSYRKGPFHMTSPLTVCIVWIYIHSVVALVYMLAIQEAAFVHMMSFLALFLLGINSLGILILIAFHQGMLYTRCCKKKPGSIIVSEKIVITV